jgi:signal transduction histidine kinase
VNNISNTGIVLNLSCSSISKVILESDALIIPLSRLQRLTQNILDVTKIENHSLNLDRESFDLNDMISKLVVEYTSRIKRTENEKGEGNDVKLIHLRIKEIIVVNADRERLNQMRKTKSIE